MSFSVDRVRIWSLYGALRWLVGPQTRCPGILVSLQVHGPLATPVGTESCGCHLPNLARVHQFLACPVPHLHASHLLPLLVFLQHTLPVSHLPRPCSPLHATLPMAARVVFFKMPCHMTLVLKTFLWLSSTFSIESMLLTVASRTLMSQAFLYAPPSQPPPWLHPALGHARPSLDLEGPPPSQGGFLLVIPISG